MKHQLTTKQRSLPHTLTNFLEDHGHLTEEAVKEKFYNELAYVVSNAPEEPAEGPWPDTDMPEFKEADPKTRMANLFVPRYKGEEYEGDSLPKIVMNMDNEELLKFNSLVVAFTEVMIFESGKGNTAYEASTLHALKLNRAVNAELVNRYRQNRE